MITTTPNDINNYYGLMVTSIATLFIAISLYFFMKEIMGRYEVALPNEWLLLIDNGVLKRAGRRDTPPHHPSFT